MPRRIPHPSRRFSETDGPLMLAREAVLERIDELLAGVSKDHDRLDTTSESYLGTLQLLRIIHGRDNVVEKQLIQAMAAVDKAKDGARWLNVREIVKPAVRGALQSLRREVETGLVGNVGLQASGEILGDFLALAREALAETTAARTNVAAVLVAAAFEDTLRRLAEGKAGLRVRPKLEEVVGILKAANILKGAAVSTANGYLKFRNDALHADWDDLSSSTVSS